MTVAEADSSVTCVITAASAPFQHSDDQSDVSQKASFLRPTLYQRQSIISAPRCCYITPRRFLNLLFYFLFTHESNLSRGWAAYRSRRVNTPHMAHCRSAQSCCNAQFDDGIFCVAINARTHTHTHVYVFTQNCPTTL